MPLTYDDVDGSWGPLSEGWPECHFEDKGVCDEAFVATHRHLGFPYGSYVRISDTCIRVEDHDYRRRLMEYVQ